MSVFCLCTVHHLPSQEPVASSDEVGEELEQVEALQKRFDNFKKDLNANEGRLDEINQIAKALDVENNPDAAAVKQRVQVSLILKYRELCGFVNARLSELLV